MPPHPVTSLRCATGHAPGFFQNSYVALLSPTMFQHVLLSPLGGRAYLPFILFPTVPTAGPNAQQLSKGMNGSHARPPHHTHVFCPFFGSLNIRHESEETLEASYLPPWPTRSTNEPTDATPGLVSGGGRSSSRSWESFTSSIQRRSRSRRAGSGAEPRAETESQEQPESTSSCRPGRGGRKSALHPRTDSLFTLPYLAMPPYLADGSEAT